MRIITVANQKGGVLKSTTSKSMAILLSRAGFKVLLMDLDPQHSLSLAFCEARKREDKSVYHVILKTKRIKDCIIKLTENIHFIPTNRSLEDLQMVLIDMGMLKDSLLREALKSIEKDYDYVIIDCPPNNTYLNTLAIHACTDLVVPEEYSEWSNDGTEFIVNSTVEIKKKHSGNIENVFILASSKNREKTLMRNIFGDKEFKKFHASLKDKFKEPFVKVSDTVIPFDEQAIHIQNIGPDKLNDVELSIFPIYNKFIQEDILNVR